MSALSLPPASAPATPTPIRLTAACQPIVPPPDRAPLGLRSGTARTRACHAGVMLAAPNAVLLRAAAPDTDRRLSRRGSPGIRGCGGDREGRRDRGRRSDAERVRRGRPRNRRPRRTRVFAPGHDDRPGQGPGRSSCVICGLVRRRQATRSGPPSTGWPQAMLGSTPPGLPERSSARRPATSWRQDCCMRRSRRRGRRQAGSS